MLIIGSGATTGSCYANKDRRPPMSNADDLSRIFELPIVYRSDVNTRYKPFFLHAIKLYDGKIEELFTALYILENSDLFPESDRDEKKIKELSELAKIIGSNGVDFSNALVIFTTVLREEIQACIGTSGKSPTMPSEMPICPWHVKIARELKAQDVVVNFNYDLTMLFALLNAKKLSRESFLNSFITAVDIDQKLLSDSPIILLTPHGSFTWYKEDKNNYHDGKKFHLSPSFIETSKIASQYKEKGQPIPDDVVLFLNQRLNPIRILVNINKNPHQGDYKLSRVILPLLKKKPIMKKFPFFDEEYQLFLDKLRMADEIYLIGKQFKTADIDIAEEIREIRSNSKCKKIYYINPDTKDHEWVEYHNSIFNSATHQCFKNLEEYSKN